MYIRSPWSTCHLPQSYEPSVHDSNFHHHILPASSGHPHYPMVQLWENSRRHGYTFQFLKLVRRVLGGIDLSWLWFLALYVSFFFFFFFFHISSRSRHYTSFDYLSINNSNITIYHNHLLFSPLFLHTYIILCTTLKSPNRRLIAYIIPFIFFFFYLILVSIYLLVVSFRVWI